MKKERQGSFVQGTKKPIIERISHLTRRHGSRSAAARAWGVNVNTLNSYFKNDVDPPMPRDNLLARIADSEGVSLSWLKHGQEDEQAEKSIKAPESRFKDESLFQILDFLSSEEKQQLAAMLARKGVETVLYLLDEDNIKLLKLDRVMKEKVLGLQPQTLEEAARIDKEARECGAVNLGQTLPDNLTSKKKQAS